MISLQQVCTFSPKVFGVEIYIIAYTVLTYAFWCLMGSALKSNSAGKPNDQGQEISRRYTRKREEISIIMQFIHSILCNIVYIYILYKIMNSTSLLKITPASYTSTLNVAFLWASHSSLVFLKFSFSLTHVFFIYTWMFCNFYLELQLCISNCFLNNPRTAHPAKSIPFELLLWAKHSARPCSDTVRN